MTVSTRSLLAGVGLCMVSLAGSAVAAPKLPTTKPITHAPTPKIDPGVLVDQGLTKAVTLTPRDLYDGGVSMNVHRAVRVEATTNTVIMDKSTQLWIYFRGAANTDYDVECEFVGTKSILTMDYASGKFVRQQSSSPTHGRLEHKVFKRAKAEDLKLYMQASGDIDWKRCTVAPS